MEEGPQVLPPLPASLEPISRPSSTSTQASAALGAATHPQAPPQLPGISSLAAGAPTTNSPQLRASAGPPPAAYATTSPASTAGPAGSPAGSLPTCHNCETSTTPLWRRDEHGAILCNACGLFLKLHGRPRPISLKTDVIKSRNRVKTVRPDLAKQKKHHQGLPATIDANGADPNGMRRGSQKLANGHVDETNSPVSRTGTPNMYNHGVGMYAGMDDSQFQGQSLPGFSVTGASPGRAASPMNGDNVPQTHDQLIAANASLKTRVTELELIQELYRGRLQQLESEQQAREMGGIESQLRSQLTSMTESETQLRKDLDESHRRENMLKRRLDELELELELKNSKESPGSHDNGRAKKPRLDDSVEKPEQPTAPTPQSES